MVQPRRWLSFSLNIVLLLGLVMIWVAFAPTKIGGQASYIIVNGVSMEPGYHSGDLVIVRRARHYQVGDVVAYRDAQMGAYVIHRIIDIHQDKVTLKGDNNTWIDAYHPDYSEIVGKQWIYAPKLGTAMRWLRTPINLSLTVALLGGVFMSGLMTNSSHAQKGQKGSLPRSKGMLEGALSLLGVSSLVFLVLSIFAFTQPLTRQAEGISYQQEGNYFYSATGTPGIYDTEMIQSGDPVFPKLTCFMNVGFTYNVLGVPFDHFWGTYQMYARLADPQSGWQRTVAMMPQTSFSGNSFVTLAPLDVCQLTEMVNLMEKETGLHPNVYTVEIVTQVVFLASTSGQVIRDAFEPVMAFKFDKVHLYLAENGGDSNPMQDIKSARGSSTQSIPNTWSILGWQFTVGFLRVFALLGLGLSLFGLLSIGVFVFWVSGQGEEALIRLRYGSFLVDVLENNVDLSQPVIDVTSIDDLARIAQRQNTVILHITLNFLHFYLVQGNGVVYRYIFSAGKKGVPAVEPVQQVAGYLEAYSFDTRPAQWEAPAYVLDLENGCITDSYPAEINPSWRLKN